VDDDVYNLLPIKSLIELIKFDYNFLGAIECQKSLEDDQIQSNISECQLIFQGFDISS